MSRRTLRLRLSIALAVLAGLLVSVGPVHALDLQAGYALPYRTMDSGGGQSTGGGYTLNGEIGRAEAQPDAATGAGYALTGGVWRPGDSVGPLPDFGPRGLYLPMISNQP